MKEKSRLNNGEIIPYALGQENKIYKGLNVIFHGGGIAGYGSYVLRIPEENFAVVYLCNSQYFHPRDIAYKIIDYYLAEQENYTEVKPVFNPTLLQSFVGDYEPFAGLIVSISKENETLFLQSKGDTSKVKLVQSGDYEFIYPNRPHSKIVFGTTKGEAANFLNWHFSDFSYKGKRVDFKPFDETKMNLNEIVGNYYNSEINTTYRLIIKDNKVVATHNINADVVLIPLQPDVFVSSYVGFFGKIEIIRNSQSIITGFYLSGQKIRRIKFDKVLESSHARN